MVATNPNRELPIPPHFNPGKVGELWKVDYQQRAVDARAWARRFQLRPVSTDQFRISLVGVDVQNTFCLPGFELYVRGRSGTGAVDDNRRLAAFIYRNLGMLTEISLTMDTHQAMQIFHAVFLVDGKGEHPAPMTLVTAEDVRKGRWKFNSELAPSLGITPEYGQELLLHYTQELKKRSKYDLTIWPYHAMLGGVGHALVPAIEEAVFFHTMTRYSQPNIVVKGEAALTENYSAIGPEVDRGPQGEPLGEKQDSLIERLRYFDAVVIAGQAKSHCVAWTIEDILHDFRAIDEKLVGKIYLLEDCSSPVVVPGVIDYTAQADAAYQRFAENGIHVVRSTDPITTWPGIPADVLAKV